MVAYLAITAAQSTLAERCVCVICRTSAVPRPPGQHAFSGSEQHRPGTENTGSKLVSGIRTAACAKLTQDALCRSSRRWQTCNTTDDVREAHAARLHCLLPPRYTAPFVKHLATPSGCDTVPLPPPANALVGAAMRKREHRWHHRTTATRTRSSGCHGTRRSPHLEQRLERVAAITGRGARAVVTGPAPGLNSLFKQRIVKD